MKKNMAAAIASVIAPRPTYPPVPKKGERGPGRPRGTVNQFNPKLSQWCADHNMRTPAELLLRWANDRSLKMEIRVEAAKAAAPYVHPKQPTAVELSGRDGASISYSIPDNGRGDAPPPGPVASSTPEDAHAQRSGS